MLEIKEMPVTGDLKKIAYGNKFILLDSDIPVWIVIDEIGLDIVSLCNGSNSPRKIVDEISKIYDMDVCDIEDEVINFISMLYMKKMIFKNLKDRDDLIRSIRKKKDNALESQLPNAPKGATIILTGYCNLKCVHCYQNSSPDRHDSLSTDEVKSILLSLSSLGAKTVAFNGGEALAWTGIYECMQLAHDLNLSITLATNGLLIHDNKIPFYIKNNNIRIQISLDGATEATHDSVRGNGMFKRTIERLEALSRAGLGERVSLSFTPMKRNISEAKMLISMAETLGIGEVKFTRFHVTGRGSESLRASTQELLELEHFLLLESKRLKNKVNIRGLWRDACAAKEYIDSAIPCPMFDMVKIDTNGYVFACAQFMDKQFAIGNIREEGLENILTPERKRPLIEQAYSRHETVEQCSKCFAKKYCVSGCMAETYSANGNVNNPDPHCDIRGRVVLETLIEVASNNG